MFLRGSRPPSKAICTKSNRSPRILLCRFEKLRRRKADLRHFFDVVGAASPEDLTGGVGQVAREVPEGGEVLRVVPVGVGPVRKAFGPEFEAGKQACPFGKLV